MLTRRSFLVAASAVSGLTGRAWASESSDVVVIGGGLAGLHAAMLLREAGLRAVVLEAGAGVGGRVHTHNTVDGPIDLGASQIGRSYGRVIDACRRLDLALVAEDRDLLTFGTHYKGTWIDNATWASNTLNTCVGEERAIPPMMMGTRLAAKYNPLVGLDDWLNPKFADLDISLRDLLRRHGHSAQAIELAALAPPGISIDGTSVLRMWQEDTRSKLDRRYGQAPGAHTGTQAPAAATSGPKLVNGLAPISNIVGGAHRLPAKMAESLGDAVHVHKRVARIEMTDTGGVVSCTDGSRFNARFIVSAIPFSMLRQVAIEADGGAAAVQAVAKMPYANTARLYLSVQPFWLKDGLPPSFATDGPLGMFWAIDNHKGSGTHRAMIVLTGPTATRISRMDQKTVETFLIAELARLRPASAGKVRALAYKDWGVDPLQRGCGFSLAPGQVNGFARTMLAPWKVMHFAGEHTRRTDFGMEAAMESGERAAVEILARAG